LGSEGEEEQRESGRRSRGQEDEDWPGLLDVVEMELGFETERK
jgi:hypothetical protein